MGQRPEFPLSHPLQQDLQPAVNTNTMSMHEQMASSALAPAAQRRACPTQRALTSPLAGQQQQLWQSRQATVQRWDQLLAQIRQGW